jgi:hypothetical protein
VTTRVVERCRAGRAEGSHMSLSDLQAVIATRLQRGEPVAHADWR